MKTTIGIDPGSKGYISVLSQDRTECFPLAEMDLAQTADTLRSVKQNSPDGLICAIEEVHAIFGSSAAATFSFGKSFGSLLGILAALRIPYALVPPKTWQREIWASSDKVAKGGKTDNKATSVNAARRLFPDADLRRTPKCAKPDDNKADSLLIAEYARRKNL